MSISNKPILRVIHHFACSGGTIFSKCIAAQPNVFLLSELNPYSKPNLNSGRANFTPTDVIAQAYYAQTPKHNELAEKIFKESIVITEQHIRLLGGHLVIRAHTHSDFCVGEETAEEESINKLLKENFEIKNLITIRDPIDSYLSLSANKWIHFSPANFDEYCKRLLTFTECIKNNTTIKYEDFTKKPKAEIEKACDYLKINKNQEFEEIVDIFKVSGDSGRSGSKIEPRARKSIDLIYLEEIEKSEHYKIIQSKYGY